MKKLFFLFALLGLIALPMFASEITFGGDVTYGVISDFDGADADSTTFTFDIKATVDDYNSVKGEFDIKGAAMKNVTVSTQIGAALELPIGLKLDWGYMNPDCNYFQKMTGYENEKIFDLSPDEDWSLGLLATIDMVEIELAFTPGQGDGSDTGDGELLAGIAIKEPIPGLNAEVYYFQNAPGQVDNFDAGIIGVDAAYGMDINDDFSIKAGVGLGYLTLEDAEPAIEYGFGLKATYSIAELTVGLDGDDVDPLIGLTATAYVKPIDLLDIYAGMKMDLSEAASDAETTFQGADIGLCVNFGATKLYLGYLVTENNNGKWKAPANLQEGGAYMKLDIDY